MRPLDWVLLGLTIWCALSAGAAWYFAVSAASDARAAAGLALQAGRERQ